MTKEELRDLIVREFMDEDGNVDISGLDFSDFDGNVDISFMKVKGDLYQNCQKVQGDLYQDRQRVKGDLWQCRQKVETNLWQDSQQVEGNLWQDYQQVKGDLVQDHQEVKGDLWQNNQNVEGDLWQYYQEVEGDLHQELQKVKGDLIGHKLEKDEFWDDNSECVIRRPCLGNADTSADDENLLDECVSAIQKKPIEVDATSDENYYIVFMGKNRLLVSKSANGIMDIMKFFDTDVLLNHE